MNLDLKAIDFVKNKNSQNNIKKTDTKASEKTIKPLIKRSNKNRSAQPLHFSMRKADRNEWQAGFEKWKEVSLDNITDIDYLRYIMKINNLITNQSDILLKGKEIENDFDNVDLTRLLIFVFKKMTKKKREDLTNEFLENYY